MNAKQHRQGVSKRQYIMISTLDKDSELLGQLMKEFADRNESNIEMNVVHTKDYQIHHCIGCNACWIATPGRCSIQDDYEKIFKMMLSAERIIFITKEKLGFITYELKNIIDRMIAVDTPYTCIVNGQARHTARYQKRFQMMLLCDGEGTMEYQKEWFERVALNFHSDSLGTFNLNRREEILHALCDL